MCVPTPINTRRGIINEKAQLLPSLDGRAYLRVATKANHSQEFLLQKTRSWCILDARLLLWQIRQLIMIVHLFSAYVPPRKPKRDSFESLLKTMGPALPISVFLTVTAQSHLSLVFLNKGRCISSSYAAWESGPLTFSQISSYDSASELWKEWAWGSPRKKKKWRFPTESQSLLECIWLQYLRRIFAVSEGVNIQPEAWDSQRLQLSHGTFHKSILPAHRPPRKQLWEAVSFPRNKSLCLARKGWRFSPSVHEEHHLPQSDQPCKRRKNSFQAYSISLQRNSDDSHPILFQNSAKKVPCVQKITQIYNRS